MRIKSKWHDNDTKSIKDISSALAFNIWRLTKNSLEDLINEGFVIQKEQVFGVILEYLCFSIQCVDRLAFDKLNYADRKQMIIELVKQIAIYYQDNKADRIKKGKYWHEFLAEYNTRANDYSRFEFVNNEPDYNFYRYFANKIKQTTTKADEKWIVQQMIEIQAPKAFKIIAQNINNTLMAVSNIDNITPAKAPSTREIRRTKRRESKTLGKIPKIKY